MARCTDCNKFVSVELAEVQVEDGFDELYGDEVNGSISMELQCAECGNTISTGSLDFCMDLSDFTRDHEHEERSEEDKKKDVEFSIEYDDPEGFDEYETINDKGRPIPKRFAKHFYGARIEVTITCDWCNEFQSYAGEEKLQASHFEEA